MQAFRIYTIGHSTHPIDYFLELLQCHNVNCVVDVRSVAASAYNPQYNGGPLGNWLRKQGIDYLHMAEAFGARHTGLHLLDNSGKVDFEKVRQTAAFKSGVGTLQSLCGQGQTIALMCSEAEPLDCHRFAMVSVALQAGGFEVWHILKDKSLLCNRDLEKKLLQKYSRKLPQPDIFNPGITAADQLRVAYRLRNQEIGYSPYDTPKNSEAL